MQLRLAFSVPKFTEPLFKQSTSAILTGVTIAGAFSTVIFNSNTARGKVSESFQAFANLLANTPLYEGIKKVAGTFKDWGTFLVSKKDDFKQWVHDYLNPQGFKSGALALYEKLRDWGQIVYEWFRDKFIKFIENIPEMVKNWKKLRLSLFKWGTFLGGGGGSALWAMFGSGDNWGKLAELMGNPAYEGLLDKFANLVQENSSAFENMSTEEAQEMLEGILEDPQEAEKMLDELAEERKEKNKKQEKEQELNEEKEELELNKDEILEKLGQPKSGKPQDTKQALKNLILAGLNRLEKNYFDDSFALAKKAMEEYFENLKKESEKETKFSKVKKEFLEAVGESKDALIREFATLSAQAYNLSADPKQRAAIFENLMKEKYTQQAGSDEEGDAEIDGLITGRSK